MIDDITEQPYLRIKKRKKNEASRITNFRLS